MQTILALYVILGLLSAVIAVPLIKGKAQPNGLYGFRVPQTLDDPVVWVVNHVFPCRTRRHSQ